MTISEEYTELIKSTLETLVEQGLEAQAAERAQECASKMLRLIAEYQEAGIIALGVVGGTVQALLE